MVVAIRRLSHQLAEAAIGDEARLGQTSTTDRGERFQCPSCGYTRLIRIGEDGFRLYLLHEERCKPGIGGQLWLSCINEDNPVWHPSEERVVVPSASFPIPRTDLGRGDEEHHLAVSRRAA